MGFVQIVAVAMVALVFLILLWSLLSACVLAPIKAHQKLRKSGFSGPKPSFPLGNLGEMKKGKEICPSAGCSQVNVSHDIHSSSLPYFANWQKLHGKVFIYWMGTEPFLYVADPEFLKQMSGGVLGKQWGKPAVFKSDWVPMFGRFGLNMIEGNDWTRHRHIITPAFSSSNLRAMTNSIAESTKKKIEQWTAVITANSSRAAEIDVENEITILGGEIIAKTNFGIDNEAGKILLDKLRAVHISVFKHTRYVGVPLGQFLTLNQTLEARRLGREIDGLLLSIIDARKKVVSLEPQHDLLGMLLEAKREDRGLVKGLTTRELVDECKTFFFAGHETVALAIAWTLLLLAMHPTWQEELRREIAEVIGYKLKIDFTMLNRLKKVGWVMSEVLRLYPSAPNAHRQARGDIRVGDKVIPNATNIWIDVVAMHHDQALWGADANEFKPERFSQDLNGNCKHKMGYVPFGFGGRMCIGRNYAIMKYKIVLSLILSKFSFSLSPSYRHSPTYSFTLRPRYGVPLVVKPL